GKEDPGEFSMEDVARRAGVSRMTVYHQFRSRAGVLNALSDHLAERGGMHRLPEVFQERDPETALRKFVGTFVGFWASDRLVLRRLRALGLVHPGLYQPVRGRDAWRRQAAAALLGKFPRPSDRARSIGAGQRAALLSAWTSFETFDELCEDGRTPEEVSALLADAMLCLLAEDRDGARKPERKRRRRDPRSAGTGLPRRRG
ncbi:MAG: TetR/AcrR family transcriptional regulator, partial [Thermoplasmata archaeon]|nr:TetR/AcrR family transcriptional regulator [Thermoplasmata archaeon]